jgi:putative tryptophan/tyrosine transport system ATP-binding protein
MSKQYGLTISGLSKSFAGNGASIDALKDLDLSVEPGEFLIVVGPNGSGKSTLLNVLAGDYAAEKGSINLNGPNRSDDWSALPRWKRATLLARVYQDPRRGTAAGLTVWENLRLASIRAGVPSPIRFGTGRRSRTWHVRRLDDLGLADKIDSRVADLSQGQRQLLALELVMLRRPALLLLDEHTASLDQANARMCLDATERLCKENGTTVLMVTHNLADAAKHGDSLFVLREGRTHAQISGAEKRETDVRQLFELCGYMT